MRWLACLVLLSGCLRARATVVHPTGVEREVGGAGSGTAIARGGSLPREVPQASDASTNIGSLELGALATTGNFGSARVHVAPGVRIFGSEPRSVLWGLAIGGDFVNNRRRKSGLAIEGAVYAGGGGNDPDTIQVAMDLFTGVTLHSRHSSIAVGPSIGLLGMPGGHSVVMLGLGLRLTNGRRN